MPEKGSYLLYLNVRRSLTLDVGRLKSCYFPAGHYIYVGSARGGIAQRIARHRRQALYKSEKIHWHIDFLLAHPDVQLTSSRAMPDAGECALSRKIAARKGVSAPVSHFGSTDCRAGCRAHFYRMHSGPCRADRPVALVAITSRKANRAGGRSPVQRRTM
jgi:Uri superfamily endonuclease